VSQHPKELFLKACGLSDKLPFVVDVEGPDEGRVVRRAFARPFAVAGRSPAADLVIDHEQVSTRHAYLQVMEGRLFCVDLGSRTGIAWGRGPELSGWVDRDSGIRIGPFRIRAAAGMGTTNLGDPLTARSLGKTDSAWPALSLEFPQNHRPPWGVSRVLTLVGRSTWCRLGLTHAEVSKIHCALLRTQEGAWLIDCFGRGGTRVNGELIRWVLLEDGDEIGVGPFRFFVRFRSSSTVADAESGESTVTLGGELARMSSRAVQMLPTTGAAVSGLPAASRSELVEPYLAHLTSQFGQLQQQMFDQFQQAMTMMAQMFGTLHRDQAMLVREELDQLRRLSQDLHSLQAKLVTRSPAATPPAFGEALVADALARIEALLSPSATTPCTTAAPSGNGPDDSAPAGRGPEQATSPQAPGAGEHGAAGTGAMTTACRPSAEKNGEPPPSSRAEPAAARPGIPTDEEIHALLHRRIATLRKEQQGHFQRIVELMFGWQSRHGGLVGTPPGVMDT
jgi:pSer/pThr/pTyr-binding forkhead associated (FHA) protein